VRWRWVIYKDVNNKMEKLERNINKSKRATWMSRIDEQEKAT
jgi:hypothetical protein